MIYSITKYGADWCSQCQLLEHEFERKSLDCAWESVDIEDLSDETLEELKIKSIPVTILWGKDIENNLVEIKRWNGFVKAEEVNKYLKEL